MAYSTTLKVRQIAGLDSLHPSDTLLTQLITYSDIEVDSWLISAKRYSEKIFYKQDGRFVDLEVPASEILEIWKNDYRLLDFEELDLLDDGDVETADSTDILPEYWNKDQSSGDTCSWGTDYSFNMYRSLKIEKASANTSSWYSDDIDEIEEKQEYKAKARIKVDSNSSGNPKLRLAFYDSSDSNLVNFDSSAVTIQVTQPTSASVLAIVSTSTADTTQKIIIEGTVSGEETTEVVSLNGTTSASSSNSFSYIKGLLLDKACAGTVTVKSNSAAVTNATFAVGAITKKDWQEISLLGKAPYQSSYARVYLICSSSTGSVWGDTFRVFKRNWKFLSSEKRIEFFDEIKKDSILLISYKRTYDHSLVEEISTTLASLRSLVWLSGGNTEADYEFLKLGGAISMVSTGKYLELKDKLTSLKEQLLKHDFHNSDFTIGKFKD